MLSHIFRVDNNKSIHLSVDLLLYLLTWLRHLRFPKELRACPSLIVEGLPRVDRKVNRVQVGLVRIAIANEARYWVICSAGKRSPLSRSIPQANWNIVNVVTWESIRRKETVGVVPMKFDVCRLKIIIIRENAWFERHVFLIPNL